jgi:hypothetical protein
MSSRLKKHLVKLRLLKNATAKVRKNILKNCSKNLLCCICECTKNVLKGNIPLTGTQKRKLGRFKRKLRKLVSKKTGIAIKKKLVQTGGFLGILLPPILSFLGSFLKPSE